VVGVAADVETVFAELTDGDRGELQLSEQESNTIVSQLFTEIMREGFADADTNVLDRDNDNAAETAELYDDDTADQQANKMRFAKTSAGLAQKAHGFFGKLKNIAKAALKVADNVMQGGDSSPAGLAASIGSNLVRGLGKGLTSRVGKNLIGKVADRAGRWLGGQFDGARFKRKDYSKVRANAPNYKNDHEPGDVEDCVACRYVWMQVEMDVGNSMIEENIYDAFHANALEAQKTPIFYPACQTMFDSIDDMLGDYMDGYSVNQICENSMLCR